MRTCQRYSLPGFLLFCAGVLLLVPAVLHYMHLAAAPTPPTATSHPVNPRVWRELDQARQLIQQELEARHSVAASNQALGTQARHHFRQAIAALPANSRTLSALREIQAETEDDFELLLVGNDTIRKLATQQLIRGMHETEQYIRGNIGS